MSLSVSVAIATYNSSTFIRRTLQSVFEQTCLPDEIVVCDDGSTDGTFQILQELSSSAPVPIGILRGRGNSGGPAIPLNTAIENATGDWIATLDHDDLFLPEKLRLQTAVATEQPECGLVFCRCEAITADGLPLPSVEVAHRCLQRIERYPLKTEESYRIPRAAAYAALLEECCYTVTLSNVLFRKDVWAAVNGFDPSFRRASDFDFMRKVSSQCDVGLVDRILVHWDRTQDSLSAKTEGIESSLEGIRLYALFDAIHVRSEDRRRIARRANRLLRSEYNGLALGHRNNGAYLAGGRSYCLSLLRTGCHAEALLGLSKLLPHLLIRRVQTAPRGRVAPVR